MLGVLLLRHRSCCGGTSVEEYEGTVAFLSAWALSPAAAGSRERSLPLPASAPSFTSSRERWDAPVLPATQGTRDTGVEVVGERGPREAAGAGRVGGDLVPVPSGYSGRLPGNPGVAGKGLGTGRWFGGWWGEQPGRYGWPGQSWGEPGKAAPMCSVAGKWHHRVQAAQALGQVLLLLTCPALNQDREGERSLARKAGNGGGDAEAELPAAGSAAAR